MVSSTKEDTAINEKHQKDFNMTKNHIVANKHYLDSLLSMDTISSQLGISKSYFSKLINTYGKHNFIGLFKLVACRTS